MSTRRELFAGALVLSEAAILAACSSTVSKKDADSLRIPEVSTWTTIEIPSDDFLAEILEFHEYPPIGLRGIFLIGQKDVPVVGIGTFWGLDELKKTTPQKFGRSYGTARVGFQEVTNKFSPNTNKVSTLNSRIFSIEAAKKMGYFVAYALLKEQTERPDQLLLARVVPRPQPDRSYTIVFGSGFVPLNGQPNPQSFLAVKFRFTDKLLPNSLSPS